MNVIRAATEADQADLIRFFLENPMRAGTSFVLDRGPDFNALLRLRGEFQTFVAEDRQGLVGTVTALWHDVRDADRDGRIGEIADLRVAERARGSRVAARLLAAAANTYHRVGADWVVCLIGDRNRAAASLVAGKAGLPRLAPLTRYASVHFIAFTVPESFRPAEVHVRALTANDGPILTDLVAATTACRRFVPKAKAGWPTSGAVAGWLATNPAGTPLGGLIVWDGEGTRRIRIMRYRGQDRLLRAVVRFAALTGIVTSLPPPGGVLRVWASRWFAVLDDRPQVARALVLTALGAAARRGQHVLQVNLAADDPVLAALPLLPRSTYWSTLFGCPLRQAPKEESAPGPQIFHADVALV